MCCPPSLSRYDGRWDTFPTPVLIEISSELMASWWRVDFTAAVPISHVRVASRFDPIARKPRGPGWVHAVNLDNGYWYDTKSGDAQDEEANRLRQLELQFSDGGDFGVRLASNSLMQAGATMPEGVHGQNVDCIHR